MNEESLKMLIDYDNVEWKVRQQGVKNVIRAVLQRLPEDVLSPGIRVKTRIYGGWYDKHRMSVTAQKLHEKIEQIFPSVVSLSSLGRRGGVYVSAELALSLSISPSANLLNTYRTHGAPRNLRARDYPFTGCVLSESACPLRGTYDFLKKGRCPERRCAVRLKDVVTRPEQKLVDTMVTADLVYAATQQPSTVVVASNDDDLWPAIHTAVNLGTTVHHVHPVVGRSTPDIYASTVGENYFQYSF